VSASPEAVPNAYGVGLSAYFDVPNLTPITAVEYALKMLKEAGLEPNRYTLDPGHGRRRNKRKRQSRRIYSRPELLEEIRCDDSQDVWLHALQASKEQSIAVMPPHPRSPFQSFIISGIPGLGLDCFQSLIRDVTMVGGLAFAGVIDGGRYISWQRCTDPKYYLKQYGPITGFRVIREECWAPLDPVKLLDVSKNPGRISSVSQLPVFVAADMWLGRAFWKYAPCTKEEVLKERWVEVADTEHYLYVKAYPEPFTRPDGEQGRLQRRLWNVLFHQDCEWPPGSGTIADTST